MSSVSRILSKDKPNEAEPPVKEKPAAKTELIESKVDFAGAACCLLNFLQDWYGDEMKLTEISGSQIKGVAAVVFKLDGETYELSLKRRADNGAACS